MAEEFFLGPHHPDASILGKPGKLFAYAHDREGEHFPAWAAFNRKLKDNRAVGIWHESYAVTPEQAENIYSNMPAFGLGAAIGVSPARTRMGGLRDPFAGP